MTKFDNSCYESGAACKLPPPQVSKEYFKKCYIWAPSRRFGTLNLNEALECTYVSAGEFWIAESGTDL